MFSLRVQLIEQTCLFDLSWNQGQRLTQTLPFSPLLISLHQAWQQAYLNFYRKLEIQPELDEKDEISYFRARGAGSGSVISQSDRRSQLVQAEARLLSEFHRWLRQEELFEIRTKIAQATRIPDSNNCSVDIFLTCSPIELTRLPWEAWEISPDLGTRKIRIVRVPVNIHHQPVRKKQRSLPRILVILGQDGNLNFRRDWEAMRQSLKHLAELPKEPIGWKPGKSIEDLKIEISNALTDDRGWDVLFFAGHSNETEATKGVIGIAPGESIHMSEIAPKLAIARDRGLQFALFNSCSGLSIAESLIDLGFAQVAILREPTHNRVAQEFLLQFLRELASYKDVHTALIDACQDLKSKTNVTYPSAHLIPSLFRHPEGELFRLHPPRWQQWLKQLLTPPTRYEAAALVILLGASCLHAVQYPLLQKRVLAQAIYRDLKSSNAADNVPPVLLVQIDDESIQKAEQELANPTPIPQSYLAKIIERLTTENAKVIGIDYLLDRPQDSTPQLAASIRTAAVNGTHFVFAETRSDRGEWLKTLNRLTDAASNSTSGAADRAWGHDDYGMPMLLSPEANQPLEIFALQLAQFHQNYIALSNQPILKGDRQLTSLLGYALGNQFWLYPITDFSLPPNQLYQTIPAWKLIEQRSLPELKHISEQTVIIAPDGYDGAGIDANSDTFTASDATAYWYQQENAYNLYGKMTGAEQHAYLVNYILDRRFVFPVPNLRLVLLAALAGRLTALYLRSRWSDRQPQRQALIVLLASGTALYAAISFAIYVSPIALLLPIVLPSLTYWIYTLPSILRRN